MPAPHAITKTLALPDGRQISIETGKLAKFADGAVVVRLGDTMLLATVVSAPSQREGVDFLPLSVDYQEKFGSAGKIPGSFQRREGRLSDYEILICRLVDRILRPMFPKDYHYEVQVMITLISADKEVQPDALAALAASAALSISDIPFAGPISEVRVARIDGQFQINPKTSDLARADMDLIVGATADSVAMVEGEMNEVSEEEMVAAIAFGHEAIKAQVQLQKDLALAVGRTPESQPREYPKYEENEALKKLIHEGIYQGAYDVARSGDKYVEDYNTPGIQ